MNIPKFFVTIFIICCVVSNIYCAFDSAVISKRILYQGSIQLNKRQGGCFHSKTNRILTFSQSGLVQLLELDGTPVTIIKELPDKLSFAILNQAGNQIAIIFWSGYIKIYNLDGRLLAAFRDPWITSAGYSANDELFISTSLDGTAKIWDINGKFLVALNHSSGVHCAIFNKKGDLVATAMENGKAIVWALKSNSENAFEVRKLVTLEGHTAGINCIMFSPTENLILTISRDKTVKIWSLNGACLATLAEHTEEICSARFSSNGNMLVTTSADNLAKIWKINTTKEGALVVKCIATLPHSDIVNAAVFNPTNRVVATASRDRSIRIWDLGGNLIAILNQHKSAVDFVEFNSTGDSLISISQDVMVILWQDRRQREFRRDALQFILAQHPRCGANSPANQASRDTMRYIIENCGPQLFEPW